MSTTITFIILSGLLTLQAIRPFRPFDDEKHKQTWRTSSSIVLLAWLCIGIWLGFKVDLP